MVIITLADKQLKYEALVRRRRAKAEEDAEKMRPDPVKLDIMSLEGYESFWILKIQQVASIFLVGYCNTWIVDSVSFFIDHLYFLLFPLSNFLEIKKEK